MESKNKPSYTTCLDRSVRPESVEISLDNGTRVAIPYVDLHGIELTTVHLLVIFMSYKVTVEGSNLRPLFQAFAQKSVKFMEETPIAERKGDHTIIARIHVAGLG